MDILYLKWESPLNNEKYIIGALCKKDNKYYFKLSQKHVEDAIKNGFSMITIPFSDFDKIYESETLFSIFKIRIPKIENFDEDEMQELLEELGTEEFDEFTYLEKTKGILLTDHFIIEKEK